jgi:hypothetical protein
MRSTPIKPRPTAQPKPTQTNEVDVEAFVIGLEHPHQDVILALRQIILSADPAVTEGIKWNAPNFRTTDDFATFHLRAKDGVQIVLHRGVKIRPGDKRLPIADPGGLLNWRDKDRAVLTFHSLAEVKARRAAFTRLLKQWIKQL